MTDEELWKKFTEYCYNRQLPEPRRSMKWDQRNFWWFKVGYELAEKTQRDSSIPPAHEVTGT